MNDLASIVERLCKIRTCDIFVEDDLLCNLTRSSEMCEMPVTQRRSVESRVVWCGSRDICEGETM